MLHEVASWPSVPAIRGWKVFHESGSAAAVLVPAELACNVRFQRNSEVTSSVLMGKLGFISAYFADTGKSMDDFEKSVLIVRMEIRKLQLAGAQYVMVGCDAQVELPPATDVTGPQLGGVDGNTV